MSKRVARVMDTNAAMPSRNIFAYFPALFIPYAGRLGAGFGFLMLVYFGIIAAAAVPAYQGYINKASLSNAVTASTPIREGLASYFLSAQKIPSKLSEANLPSQLADGSELSVSTDDMALTVQTKHGELVFTPKVDKQGKIYWICSSGKGLTPIQLPPVCTQMGN